MGRLTGDIVILCGEINQKNKTPANGGEASSVVVGSSAGEQSGPR